MRATINFDVNIDKVEQTMVTLVHQEVIDLYRATTILEDIEAPNLLEQIGVAINTLETTAAQLNQYKSMIVGFQRAKYETLLPQDAPANTSGLGNEANSLREAMSALENMKGFEDFLSQVPADEDDEEIPVGEVEDDSEEG